jgi:hypothetical protein
LFGALGDTGQAVGGTLFFWHFFEVKTEERRGVKRKRKIKIRKRIKSKRKRKSRIDPPEECWRARWFLAPEGL